MRVAIIHYWFSSRRGGERVVEALAEMYPEADIFALLADPNVLGPAIDPKRIQTSFIQRIPGSRRLHRHLLPLYPYALEQFDLRSYDLVISSESGPAKGVITTSETCHICYCHSPMRYLWDMFHDYKNGDGGNRLVKTVFSATAHYVRQWDLNSASRVDYFVANSQNVARRIRKHYRRSAEVIYPPVRVSDGFISNRQEDYYLVVGQLVSYKRIDLAIQACNQLRRPLRIIGDGEQYKALRRMAGNTVEFWGSVSDEAIRDSYSKCRALLFPGVEDFGIVPIEAQSFGRPVIAFGRGGALETVRGFYPGMMMPSDASGVFFSEQTSASLSEAIEAFERTESRFSPHEIRHNVSAFDARHFKTRMGSFVSSKLAEFGEWGASTEHQYSVAARG